MQCARCTGMSVSEIIVEGGARIFVMRCVHCGDIIDQVILMNRHRQYEHLGRFRTSIYEDHQPQPGKTHIDNEYRSADSGLNP